MENSSINKSSYCEKCGSKLKNKNTNMKDLLSDLKSGFLFSLIGLGVILFYLLFEILTVFGNSFIFFVFVVPGFILCIVSIILYFVNHKENQICNMRKTFNIICIVVVFLFGFGLLNGLFFDNDSNDNRVLYGCLTKDERGRVIEDNCESKMVMISPLIVNEDRLSSGYSVSNVDLSKNEIKINGSSNSLERIAVVKAIIDLEYVSSAGKNEITLKDVPLVAYDNYGRVVDVEFVSEDVYAVITVAAYSKQIPLKVIPNGMVSHGKAISDIKLSITNVKVFGAKSVIDNIDYIPVDVDVSNLINNKEFFVDIDKPAGVTGILEKSVVVEVLLGNEKEKQIDSVAITTKNLGDGLNVQVASQQDSATGVIVKGTANNLKNVTSEHISAYVDLQGLEKGVHKVPVKVTGEDLKLLYIPKTKTVTVIIK